MARCMMTHGPYDIDDGLATGRQYGPEPQHEEPVIGWGRKSRLKRTQYWHSKIWQLHTLSLSWLWIAWSQIVEYYCTMKSRFFPPQKRAKVELSSRRKACKLGRDIYT
jgi:hypothetical protein